MRVVQVQVHETGPLGCPHEAAIVEGTEHVVEIHPDLGRLGQQCGPAAGRDVEPDQFQPGLLSVFDLGAE